MGAWIGISLGALITAALGIHDWKTAALVSLAACLAVCLDRQRQTR